MAWHTLHKNYRVKLRDLQGAINAGFEKREGVRVQTGIAKMLEIHSVLEKEEGDIAYIPILHRGGGKNPIFTTENKFCILQYEHKQKKTKEILLNALELCHLEQ